MTAPDNANAEEAPRRLTAGERRFLAWGIALFVVGGYLIFQLFSVWTVKDAVPPASLITAPAGATIVGEPRISREPYRATTYVTIRPAEGRNHVDLMQEMGLSEQPTQITGPTPLDWRTLWVYGRPVDDGVEFRLVYLRDPDDIPTTP